MTKCRNPAGARMESPDLTAHMERQRAFFLSGGTLPLAFRLEALKRLRQALCEAEDEIARALECDLGKSAAEGYLTEAGIVLAALSHTIRHLRAWMRPRFALPSPAFFPALGRVYAEPFGLVLIMAPWNYPLNLALMPLVDAVAAGNCVVLKPSSRAPATSRLLESLITRAFDPAHVRVVPGGAETGDALLARRFDFIFYTGSARVGRKVMEAAARHLTPVCLELGGKSPVIVCEDADCALAARRIAWGKTLNAGQTCVAPDYVLVHESLKERLVRLLREEFLRFPGPDAPHNPGYCRIISPEALERLEGLSCGQAKADRNSLRMAPLVMDDAGPDDPVMREEIFGPLLPVLAFSDVREALALVRERDKPLACYVFTRSGRTARDILDRLSFGGGCVNDTVMHVGSHHLPFGGVGASGMGRYHGRSGFELFSNRKGVLHRGTWLDPPLRYLPIKGWALAIIRRLLR